MFSSGIFAFGRHVYGLTAAAVIANFGAWVCALMIFHQRPALMGVCLLAWCYGLRHAMDADHLVAIDTVIRKMMQRGLRPYSIGAWFSLGHTSIVMLATIALAAAHSAFMNHLGWFSDVGSVTGTIISAVFLLFMALSNMLILFSVTRRFFQYKRGVKAPDNLPGDQPAVRRGRLMNTVFRGVNRNWHMFLVGVVFGLGFESATEVSLLGIASATTGIAVWSILVFPLLFGTGMMLIDTLDNVLMINAYGWAFNQPQRKLVYNMVVTGASIILALMIGGGEILSYLARKEVLHGPGWNSFAVITDNPGMTGAGIAGLFCIMWSISFLRHRLNCRRAM